MCVCVCVCVCRNPASQLLLTYQAQEVLIPEGKTTELMAALDRSDAALKAGPDLYLAALSWCMSKGQKQMADAVVKHASDKYPDNIVSRPNGFRFFCCCFFFVLFLCLSICLFGFFFLVLFLCLSVFGGFVSICFVVEFCLFLLFVSGCS